MSPSKLHTLSQILVTADSTQRIVAQSDQTLHTLNELQRRVAFLSDQLQAYPNAERWILSCQSTWAAAIALLALSHCSKQIVLPQNNQPGTLSQLEQSADGLLSDMPLQHNIPYFNPLGGLASKALSESAIAPQDIKMTLYTSGSTGEGKKVEKRLSQLTHEVENLEEVWGNDLDDCVLFTTVSHQHIYGLLFGLLWPLMAGRAFTSSSQRSPKALVNDIAAVSKAALVSCPAHLSRFPELVSFERLHPSCQKIFSSGGPLHRKDALRVAELTKQAPVEVFGSTETGGVAWRQQTADSTEAMWTPFEKVEIRQEPETHGLQVRSLFASVDGIEWQTMGDKIVLHEDGRFAHQGRMDRIIKLEQKRVSLPNMEAQLNEHAWVQESSLCVTQRASGRKVLAGVVALTEEGEEAFGKEGRKPLVVALQQHLSRFFEREVLPKRWAFTNNLPRNEQGKVTQESVLAYFQPSSTRWPITLSSSQEEASYSWELQVPNPYLYCDGHFEEKAIVPGVVQLQWVKHFADQVLPEPIQITQMEAIKFQHILCPGDLCSLDLRVDRERNKVRFQIQRGETSFSSGRFVIAREGAASGD